MSRIVKVTFDETPKSDPEIEAMRRYSANCGLGVMTEQCGLSVIDNQFVMVHRLTAGTWHLPVSPDDEDMGIYHFMVSILGREFECWARDRLSVRNENRIKPQLRTVVFAVMPLGDLHLIMVDGVAPFTSYEEMRMKTDNAMY